jgi:hypothetical protein
MRTQLLKLAAEFDRAYEEFILIRNRMEAGDCRGLLADIAKVRLRLEEGICLLGEIKMPLLKMIEGCVELESRPEQKVPSAKVSQPVFPPEWFS